MSQEIYVLIEHLKGQVTDISYVMLAAAGQVAEKTGGRVVALLLGHQAQALAGNLAADQVWYVDHPALAEFTSDAYQRVLTGLIRDKMPRLVLVGDSSIGSEVAGSLSVGLGLPLVSYCRRIWAEGDTLKFASQIYGGKMMAEGSFPDTTSLVAMIPGGYKAEQGQSQQPPELVEVEAPPLEGLRVSLKQYFEPDTGDVDISKEPVLVAVGRGLQNEDDLELAEELAEALGGAVCASRPVVDQGWLPTSRLVGKSGHRVKPKLYLALGISGAPEHVESLTDSEIIVAVNTDPAAPIFDLATYGIEADMFDLLPVLTEQIEEARGE
jgi:electron transfer flavoprotein alpha subunit